MKKIFWIVLLGAAMPAFSKSSKEKITKELAFEKKGPANALMIFNINGHVKVEAYNSDKVLLEVEKWVSGKTEARLAKGKAEVQLGVLDRADTLMLYIAGICNEFGQRTRKKDWNRRWNGWGYDWDNNCRGRDCDREYDYRMNFTIKVPATISVLASTINNGDVVITGITNRVVAENINGDVALTNIAGPTHASTINGSVYLDYSGNPTGDSRYYSLNGDINANFRKGLAAQLAFKSFNGEFYSSLNEITPMPVQVEKYEKGEGIHYRVSGNRYKVRQGGPLLDFETFNGDVFLKEKSN